MKSVKPPERLNKGGAQETEPAQEKPSTAATLLARRANGVPNCCASLNSRGVQPAHPRCFMLAEAFLTRPGLKSSFGIPRTRILGIPSQISHKAELILVQDQAGSSTNHQSELRLKRPPSSCCLLMDM